MRKYFALILPLLLFTLVIAGPPFQGDLDVIGRCQTCCIETYPINFTITIDNTNSAYYYYVKEYWVKTEGGTTLGDRVRYQNITIPQHTVVNLYINSYIPPVLNNSFGYKVCIEYMYIDNYNIEREEELCSILSNKQAFPISDYFGKEICCKGDDCAADERCSGGYTCHKLDCGSCQYILNHNCYDHDCCDNSACNQTSTCVSNVCTPINCAGEIVNQTCIGFLGLPAMSLPEWISGIFGEEIATFIETNMIMLILGVVFVIIFIGLIFWLFKGGKPDAKKKEGLQAAPKITLGGEDITKEKPKKKTTKKKESKKKSEKKKGKKRGGEEESGPEYVPLVELPE